MTSVSLRTRIGWWATLALLATMVLLAAAASAQVDAGVQPPEPAQLVRIAVAPVEIAAGGTAEAQIQLTIASPWHINANPPSPDYMIPTAVSLKPAAGVTPGKPAYPAAHQLKVEFDEQPLAVYDGTATIRIALTAAADAENGSHVMKGTLRFQACDDRVCLAPASLPLTIAVTVTGGSVPGSGAKGAASGATAGTDTTSAGQAGAATQGSTRGAAAGSGPLRSVPGASMGGNPLADALGRGGLVAFATLFVIGLALNLTPCVYPMLGVTVSIFGARAGAPPLRVLGSALIYVLGMTAMYSGLGVAAALTGGLFGSFLQSPAVLIGIGVLLFAMSLSMFGLFELQPPAWLLSRIGGSGTTSAIGLFLSGLVVGVFAAPCVGPPVVALLAVVGAKADPWFGFVSFFTLALGLGAPYLVLGTFSNLIQRLPRSGAWMVWVKKLFGVILASIGLFYVSLGIDPRVSVWVIPAALVIGGAYLGLLENSAAGRPTFTWIKRGVGIAAIAAGAWMLMTPPREGIAFRDYDPVLVQQALQAGKPVILDFSADWCLPCHELERKTFNDPRVIEAARRFEAFKVDLTHADSPEAEARVREFRIPGVPTVVFIGPDGREIDAARFTGFLPPDDFLERLKQASGTARAAS